MIDINSIKTIKSTESVPEKVSLAPPEPKKIVQYRVPKVELSEDIKNFDQKSRERRSTTPYDYNSVSLQRTTPIQTSQTAFQMITNPVYNTIGKFLGVDTLHDWNSNYEKVETIVEWAKLKTGSDKIEKMLDFLNGASNFVPTFGMNHKKIDQIHLYAQLQLGNLRKKSGGTHGS